MKNRTLSIKKSSLWKYSAFIILAAIIVGGFVVFSGDDEASPTQPAQPAQTSVPTEPEKVPASQGDDAVLGNTNAPVTIIEYLDYQCPFCGRHYSQTFPQIKSRYVDSGKVKYIVKDFPLANHPLGMPSAIATECVREQGGDEAFWKMHDKIFENQQALSEANLKTWAQELGYNINSCLSSNKFRGEATEDIQEGQNSGISGTPGFLVLMEKDSVDVQELISMQQPDQRGGWGVRYVETEKGLVGVRINGAYPFDVFQKAIEAGF